MSRRVAVVIGVSIGLGVVLAFITLASFLGFHDPTEDAFAVTLHNDTGSPVVLLQCDVRCNEFHERVTVPPGGNLPTNVSSAGVVNTWEVLDTHGHMIGCLQLRFDHKQDGVLVDVSGMRPPPC